MSAEQQTITNDTIMSGVVCKKCGKVLPDHTVRTHLEDPKNSIFKCPSHKPKQEGFKWGQELLKWKTVHAELQKKYDDLVEKTLEENEGFLGEVSKDGYKDGHSDGYMEAKERYEKENEELKKELEYLKKNHIIVPHYFIDEENGRRIYNVEEMTFEFERQLEEFKDE
jgi:hypothetical protein